jgi:hypothetical protein
MDGVSMRTHLAHVSHLETVDGGAKRVLGRVGRGFIPSVLKGYSRKILQRGIDAILGSSKTEAEHRASSRPAAPDRSSNA